jgi:hypothetical protein
MRLIFFVVVLSLLLSASSVKAITITESPNADAWLQSWAPDTNRGDAPDKEMYMVYNPTGPQMAHTVTNFSISDIPAGSTINSAIWSCQLAEAITPANGKFNISEISDDWAEMVVTWNNFNGHYNASLTSFNTTKVSAVGDYLNFTVTDIVQKWVNGEPIRGFYITTNKESGSLTYATCWQREKGGSYVMGTLTIDYTPPAAPYISATFNFSTVNFGSLSAGSSNNPAQLNGIYNVSVDTSVDYQIKALGTAFVDGSELCYQETANVSTSCGGLNTGTYECVGSFSGACDLGFDGNWNTHATASAGTVAYIYVNYTKPSEAVAGNWTISGGASGSPTTVNKTIPSSCWNFDANKLASRVVMNAQAGQYSVNGTIADCYNGTAWENVWTVAYAAFKEDAMWWNIVHQFSVGNLRMDTNSTAGNINVGSAVALSAINQTVDSYLSSATVNYYGFWLSVPNSQFGGNYQSTVPITYDTV